MTNEMSINKPSFEELLKKSIHCEKEYFEYVKALYDEWNMWIKTKENYPSFEELKKFMPELNPDLPPQFFTGDIQSNVVMISLNGHAGDKKKDSEVDATGYCKTWDDYLKFWINFVNNRYALNGSANVIQKLSNFDEDLHHFLSGNNSKITSNDLLKWNFFHMELCPFLSNKYSVVKASARQKMMNYLLRVLEAIALHKRDLILVLNGQVCAILDQFIIKKHKKKNKNFEEDLQVIEKNERSDNLIKKNKEKTSSKVKRIDYTVKLMNLGEKTLKIIAVPTFAGQSLAGDLLVEYNKFAFTDEEREIINKAIGISDNAR
jgi:hypothetical protein